jgi:hypothetical protein
MFPGLLLAVAALAASASVNAEGTLDGKAYDVMVTMPNGRQEENTYLFADGKLKSAACAINGYPAAPYTAKSSGNVTTVTAILKNDRGDSRTVDATIEGNRMRGTVNINKDGETSKWTFAPLAAAGAAAPTTH